MIRHSAVLFRNATVRWRRQQARPLLAGVPRPPLSAHAEMAAPQARALPQITYTGAPAAEDAADDEPSLDLGQLFALKSPKNAVAGTGQCVRNVLTGVAVGVGSLVAAPIMGAKMEGAKGFAKGLGAGEPRAARTRRPPRAPRSACALGGS